MFVWKCTFYNHSSHDTVVVQVDALDVEAAIAKAKSLFTFADVWGLVKVELV